jgi:hypothetical protein
MVAARDSRSPRPTDLRPNPRTLILPTSMARVTGLARKLVATTGVLLLLLSSSADALGLHRCAHHDALPSADQTESGHHGHHSAPADDKEQSESCTCVGTCSVSSAVIAPTANASIAVIAPTRAGAEAPKRATPSAKSAEYLLPWSTAPPVL